MKEVLTMVLVAVACWTIVIQAILEEINIRIKSQSNEIAQFTDFEDALSNREVVDDTN